MITVIVLTLFNTGCVDRTLQMPLNDTPCWQMRTTLITVKENQSDWLIVVLQVKATNLLSHLVHACLALNEKEIKNCHVLVTLHNLGSSAQWPNWLALQQLLDSRASSRSCGEVQALAKFTVSCSWTRHFPITMPSKQFYLGNLAKCQGTCNGPIYQGVTIVTAVYSQTRHSLETENLFIVHGMLAGVHIVIQSSI